jgi:hypothetical protein
MRDVVLEKDLAGVLEVIAREVEASRPGMW